MRSSQSSTPYGVEFTTAMRMKLVRRVGLPGGISHSTTALKLFKDGQEEEEEIHYVHTASKGL